MTDRIPITIRTLPLYYGVMHELTKDDQYLTETRKDFIGRGMKLSKGMMNPFELNMSYEDLMGDAGLQPLEEIEKDG